MANESQWPNYRRPEAKAVDTKLALVHNLIEGTDAVHGTAPTYIKKWKGEKDAVYSMRSTCEPVFPALARTLDAAVGMLHAVPPEITWGSAENEMKPVWSNIDGAGNIGEVFVKRLTDAAIRDGIAAILTDGPPPAEDEDGNRVLVHGGNEDELGRRPVWSAYTRASILSWRTTKVGGEEVLTQIVFKEMATENDGVFGISYVPKYRRVFLDGAVASWQVWIETGDTASPFNVEDEGVFRNAKGRTRNRLPVRFAYTGCSDGIMDSSIPLLGVAHLNLAHWQTATDIRFYEMICAHPQPVVVGQMASKPGADGTTQPASLQLGPLAFVQVSEGGDFKWVELTGTALERLEKALLTKAQQIAQMGASFLAVETRAAETAEAKRIDAAAQQATLATAAQGIDDCVNGAFEDLTWFMGLDVSQAPTFKLNRDFENQAMPSDVMRAWVEALKAGVPEHLFLRAWYRGKRIEVEDEKELDAIGLLMTVPPPTDLDEIDAAA